MPFKLPVVLEAVFAQASHANNNHLFTAWKACNSISQYLAVLNDTMIQYGGFTTFLREQIAAYRRWLVVAEERMEASRNRFDLDPVESERVGRFSKRLDKLQRRRHRNQSIFRALETLEYCLMKLMMMGSKSDRGSQPSTLEAQASLMLKALIIETDRETESLIAAEAADEDGTEADATNQAVVEGEEVEAGGVGGGLPPRQEEACLEGNQPCHRRRRRVDDDWD